MTNDDTGKPPQPSADADGTEPADARPVDTGSADAGTANAEAADTGAANTGLADAGSVGPDAATTHSGDTWAGGTEAAYSKSTDAGQDSTPSSSAGPSGHSRTGGTEDTFRGPNPRSTGFQDASFADSGPGAGRTGHAGPGPAGPHQRPPQRAQLRRERQSRMIAGVCGGLGRHLDIDPVVFRIMFVVLTFFGGLGLLIYAALWLFVPIDGERESEAQRLLTGASALAAVAITVVLVLGFMAMVGTISDGFGRAVPLLVVAAAIVAVLVWRNENRHSIAPDQGRSDFSEPESGPRGWGAGAGPQPQPWWQRPVPAHPAPSASTGTGSISGAEFSSGQTESSSTYGGTTESRGSADRGAAATDYGVGWSGTAGYGTAWPGASGYGTAWPNAGGYVGASTSGVGTGEGEPGGQITRGRRLSGVALSGILVAVGILGVLAAGGAIHIGWSAGFALTIMAIGAGMVIGGLYGRTRWLIPVGLVLAIPLIVGNALGVPLRGDTGNVDWNPGSVAAATASTYELAAGKGSLDLSAVNPAGGVVHVAAHIGAGRLIVTVPDNVAVQLTAHVGAGEIQFVDGTKENGLDVTRNVDASAIGASKGTIALNLRVGTGIVEVDRVNG